MKKMVLAAIGIGLLAASLFVGIRIGVKKEVQRNYDIYNYIMDSSYNWKRKDEITEVFNMFYGENHFFSKDEGWGL